LKKLSEEEITENKVFHDRNDGKSVKVVKLEKINGISMVAYRSLPGQNGETRKMSAGYFCCQFQRKKRG